MEFDATDVYNGGCKSIGTPRTAEEAYAVRNLKIPAELVRRGILTTEQYEGYKSNSDGIALDNGTNEFPESQPTVPTEEVGDEVDIHAAFLAKFEKEVPNRYKNDKEWIIKKLNS